MSEWFNRFENDMLKEPLACASCLYWCWYSYSRFQVKSVVEDYVLLIWFCPVCELITLFDIKVMRYWSHEHFRFQILAVKDNFLDIQKAISSIANNGGRAVVVLGDRVG